MFTHRPIYILFIFAFIFTLSILYTIFLFSPSQKNKIAEKLFLNHNYNKSALFILNFSNTNKNTTYYTYFLKGRIYFVEGKLYESVQNYSTSISMNPDHKEAYYGRGLAYGFIGGQFLEKGEEDFKKYIEIDGEDFNKSGRHAYGAWAAYNDLAWIYFLKNDFTNQEEIARKGLDFSSGNPWLLNSLGVSLLAQDKCHEAMNYFSDAKKLIEETNISEFGEAYSGDRKEFWSNGLHAMKNTIVDNLETCKK